MARKAKSTKPKSTKRPAAKATSNTVMAWQDDPISKLPLIALPVPTLAKAPLKLRIKGPAVKPGVYDVGTPQFRYWNTAVAVRRGADFWAPLLGVTRWQPGAVLPVGLDEGKDLNAYYDRTELAFFHDTAGGKTVYSGTVPTSCATSSATRVSMHIGQSCSTRPTSKQARSTNRSAT